MFTFTVSTSKRKEFQDITSKVQQYVVESKVTTGICTVFIPHTTAAVTINENADPTVARDILYKLGDLIPKRDKYRHMEGNSDAHVKALLCGSSERILVSGGRPVLGTWQSVYFCEFDGPRTRRVIMRMD